MHNEITIGKALKLKSGKFLSAKNMITGNYQVYGGNGQIGCHNEYIFEDEKIIIGRVGAYCGNVHKTKPFSWITDNALYVDKKLFPFEDDYLVYLLKAKQLNKYASKSGQPLISFERIKKIKIPLPPLPIQKKIAEILDTADALKQKDKALITKYNELTQSLFLDMFGDPVTNPNEWEICGLLNVCAKITDGTHQSPKFLTTGIPFLFVSNITDNKIDYNTQKYISEEEYITLTKSTPIEVGDILYTSVGSYGNPAIVDSDKKFCFQRHIAHLKPNHNLVNVTFLHSMLMSPLVKRQANKFARGVAQKTLNLREIKKMNIFLPPIELQNEFAEQIKIIEQQKQLAEQSLKKSEDLFNCLLQKAFKGELVS